MSMTEYRPMQEHSCLIHNGAKYFLEKYSRFFKKVFSNIIKQKNNVCVCLFVQGTNLLLYSTKPEPS